MSLTSYQKELDQRISSPHKSQKRRNKIQWLLMLFIILGFLYNEYRFNRLESILNSPPVEYLIVTSHLFGSRQVEGKGTYLDIFQFNCNGSRIDSTLWVNGSAMTGKHVTYFWVLMDENRYLLSNWTLGWIEK